MQVKHLGDISPYLAIEIGEDESGTDLLNRKGRIVDRLTEVGNRNKGEAKASWQAVKLWASDCPPLHLGADLCWTAKEKGAAQEDWPAGKRRRDFN